MVRRVMCRPKSVGRPGPTIVPGWATARQCSVHDAQDEIDDLQRRGCSGLVMCDRVVGAAARVDTGGVSPARLAQASWCLGRRLWGGDARVRELLLAVRRLR
jgi:hypothetical protein